MTKLLDCTTRDGGYSVNWNYSDEYIFDLMENLNQNRVHYYEIGYRNYYDREGKGPYYYCIPELIKKFYYRKNNLKLGIMVDTKRYNENNFINGENDYVDFVRIATHPDRIKDSLLIAEKLKNKNYNVMIQLMDITNLQQEQFNLLEKWKNKDILETLYLADTYGIVNSDELKEIYNKMNAIGYTNISFHAHNKNNQALNNSLKAIELGVFSIDVTQDGNGINGGNLQYKDLMSVTA